MSQIDRRIAALEVSSKENARSFAKTIVRIIHQIVERDGTKAERLEREFAIGDEPGPWKVS